MSVTFSPGQRITLAWATPVQGVVSEIVPAGRVPRTLHQANLRPRSSDSYVVTILTEHLERRRRPGAVARPTIGARRVWPDATLLRPRAKEVFSYA